jgi:four helix bundle protein
MHVYYFSKKVMHNFRELKIWQEALIIAKEVFILTKQFPSAERYGLINQMSRCSVSIASNIAEGSSRRSNKEFIHFLNISLGSCYELETQIIISSDFGYVNDPIVIIKRIQDVQRMINGFIRQLK